MKNIYLLTILFFAFNTKASGTEPTTYLICLAGGAGERLWPLSKKDLPKQFLKVHPKYSLLEETLHRAKSIKGKTTQWAVITHEFENKMNAFKSELDRIIVEPARRDTAPAILLATLHAAQEDPEAVVAFFPTDHYIPQHDHFAFYLNKAIDHAKNSNDITLIGIQPTYPATGYGYLIYDENNLADGIAKLDAFREKPDLQTAKEYILKGNALWNAGIICARARTLIEAYKTYAHQVYEATYNYFINEGNYEANPKISVDFAIAEKYPDRAVISADIIWSDVGDLKSFITLNKESEKSQTIEYEARNNLVFSQKKLITLIGVENLCIVETDNELLILPQSDVQKVRELVNIIKDSSNLQEHL